MFATKFRQKIDRRGKVVVKLLPSEIYPFIYFPEITTVTFYEGDHVEFANTIRLRVREILKANPWLTGRLHWSDRPQEEGDVILVYKDSETESKGYKNFNSKSNNNTSNTSSKVIWNDDDIVKNMVLDDHFQHYTNNNSKNICTKPKASTWFLESLSVDSSIDSINRAAHAFAVKIGIYCLRNPPNEPLFRVSVVPGGNNSKDPQGRKHFSLIVSVSHVIADGHTYYQIYNMLDPDTPIVSLSTNRRIEFMKNDILEKMGGAKESMYAEPPWKILTIFVFYFLTWWQYWPFKNYLAIYSVDNDYVKITKTNHQKKLEGEESNKKSTDTPTPSALRSLPPYISSNDIITSDLLTAMRPDVGAMVFNCRVHLEKDGPLSYTDAGSYQEAIQYLPPDYASPVLIRQSIQHLRRVCTFGKKKIPHLTRMPSVMTISNWATFAKDVKCEGARPILHMPILDTHNPFRPYFVSIIFRMNSNGDLGLLFRGTKSILKKVKDEVKVLQKAIHVPADYFC